MNEFIWILCIYIRPSVLVIISAKQKFKFVLEI